MGHSQQQAAQAPQHRPDQFASYAPGQTYAEAAGTSGASGPVTATAVSYGESPRIVSNGTAPRSRLSTPGTGQPAIARQPGTHTPSYGGAGLMDHLAYPRNATALGPASSGSLSSFFQGSSQSSQAQSQSQQQLQQRREGRTVPTASTMFGPNSTSSATNSPIASSFPFNQAQVSLPAPSNPPGAALGDHAPNGMAKDVKQENMAGTQERKQCSAGWIVVETL
jgi:hypothetical protein